MKQYIGISRDHSGSMQGVTRNAMNDYNGLIEDVKAAAIDNNIDTIVSTVLCGIGPGRGRVEREIVNSTVARLQPLRSYVANGGSTPLWDSVMELIHIFQSVPDYDDPDVSFMVMVVTDGGENSSSTTAGQLAERIRSLQNSDRWTFVFRVPRGYKNTITRNLGVYDDNVIEWEAGNARSLEQNTQVTRSAMTQFYSNRASGQKSTSRFYANLVQVPASEIKKTLSEVSGQVQYFFVPNDSDIRTFVESKTRAPLMKGSAFYQLTKSEDVQDHKEIAVRDKTSRKTYSGHDARTLLGLPLHGTIKLLPGNNGNFDVFVQSTSTNRKLIGGTELLYWPNQAR